MLHLQKNVPKATTASNDEDEGNIDLYGDINIDMGLEENNPNEEFGITSSPARLNRSDSILDIHTTVDFEETDLPESESETVHMKSSATDDSFVLPEPSKWEREEDAVADKCNYFHTIYCGTTFKFIFDDGPIRHSNTLQYFLI